MMRAFGRRPAPPAQPPMTSRFLPRIAALLIAGALGLPTASHAADKPREGSFGKGKPSGPLLTPAQLRSCLEQQGRLRGHVDETTKQQAALEASKAEIDRLDVALKDDLAALDRTSADAVAVFNAQVEKRDKMIDDYQQGVPAFNTRVEAPKAEQAAFAKACENRRYDESDEISIRKGK